MSKTPQYKLAGYLIPEVIDPDDCICVCVPIPNDERHIQAFKAQLFALSRWWAWERDDLKRGKDAAAVWAGIYECVEARMDNNCGCGGGGNAIPMQYRYTPEGQLEVSQDGGITWEDGSAYDERNQVAVYPPPITPPTDSECLYAENVTDKVKQVVEITINNLESGGTVASAAGAILPALVALGLVAAPAAVFMILLYGIAATVISVIAEGIGNSFDSTFWGEFKCMWYCVINPDGEVTDAMIESVKQEVSAYFGVSNPLAIKTIQDTIGMLGANMLTNAARMGDSILSSDCDDCGCDDEWCYNHNFLFNDGDFEARAVFSGVAAVYSASGWTASNFRSSAVSAFYRGAEITKSFTATIVTKIEVEFDLTIGSYAAGSYGVVRIEAPYGNVREQISNASAVSGVGQTIVWEDVSGVSLSQIAVLVDSSVQPSASYSGQAAIKRVTMWGKGTNPFGTDNCE